MSEAPDEAGYAYQGPNLATSRLRLPKHPATVVYPGYGGSDRTDRQSDPLVWDYLWIDTAKLGFGHFWRGGALVS